MVKHKAWETTIVAPKSEGSMTTIGQMKPTCRVILMASRAGENSQSNVPEHMIVSSILTDLIFRRIFFEHILLICSLENVIFGTGSARESLQSAQHMLRNPEQFGWLIHPPSTWGCLWSSEYSPPSAPSSTWPRRRTPSLPPRLTASCRARRP